MSLEREKRKDIFSGLGVVIAPGGYTFSLFDNYLHLLKNLERQFKGDWNITPIGTPDNIAVKISLN